MNSLESELRRARELDVSAIADAVESIGFECTRCGACCKAAETDEGTEPHAATVFPDEIRTLQAAGEYDWRDVARPMPYGLDDEETTPEVDDGEATPEVDGGEATESTEQSGETFEWALAVDDCGDCTFYTEDDEGVGTCTVHGSRPLVCRTYPFSIGVLSTDADGGNDAEGSDVDGRSDGDADGTAAPGRTEPMGGVVQREGPVRAHECAGLGRDISRADAEELAATLKERAVRELEEAIGVRDNYEPANADGVVVHDSEGQKRPDGTPLEDGR